MRQVNYKVPRRVAVVANWLIAVLACRLAVLALMPQGDEITV
jgi:hypothetical protein